MDEYEYPEDINDFLMENVVVDRGGVNTLFHCILFEKL